MLYKPVDVWQKHPKLSIVRKYRAGRHRFYFIGEHTDCNYTVIYVLVSKRNEDDRPEENNFQKKLIRALSDESDLRLLPLQIPEE